MKNKVIHDKLLLLKPVHISVAFGAVCSAIIFSFHFQEKGLLVGPISILLLYSEI